MLDQWAGRTAYRYANFVADVVQRPYRFDRFRGNRVYRRVVETVTAEEGRQCFGSIKNDAVLAVLLDSEYADKVGRPSTINVAGRAIAPTTIRYGAILADMIQMFPDFLSFENFCEIGVGYGGLARLICEFHKRESGGIQRYRMFDLPYVLHLARRYIEHFSQPCRFEYVTKSEIAARNNDQYDFIISNWAFSEFAQDLQIEYLDKVVSKARSGYMIMNTGLHGNKRGYGGHECLSDVEIMQQLPNCRIVNPDTATPKGYVISFRREAATDPATGC